MSITATRISQPLSQLGMTVTVVDKQQIQDQKIQQTSDALREVPGVVVTQSGGPGRMTDVSYSRLDHLAGSDPARRRRGQHRRLGFLRFRQSDDRQCEPNRSHSWRRRIALRLICDRRRHQSDQRGRHGRSEVQSPLRWRQLGHGATGRDGQRRNRSPRIFRLRLLLFDERIPAGKQCLRQSLADLAARLSPHRRHRFARVRPLHVRRRRPVGISQNFLPGNPLDPTTHQRTEFMLYKGEMDSHITDKLLVRWFGSFVRDEIRINKMPSAPVSNSGENDRHSG